ncbi:MAG: hypothetical protein KF884_06040 [Fimbriimonadaceae bacterium]|nr:hypothetical protein [Fimbriimonadaceae bacterium]QYK59645.1 MAG: hypothetical protein KF884_06040 [Fimbriimonadaceae bacterium]
MGRSSASPVLLSLLTLLLASPAMAQSLAWQGVYSESVLNREVGHFVRTDTAGNVYTATGLAPRGFYPFYNSIFVTKRSAAGGELWRKVVPAAISSQSLLNDMILDRQGNPIVLFNDAFTLGVQNSTRVVKFATSNGAVLWNQPAPIGVGYSIFNSRLAVDAANNPIVGLTDSSLAGFGRYRVIKLAAANGTPVWNKLLSRNAPTQTDLLTDITVDSVNNIVATGTTGAGDCAPNPVSSSLTFKIRGTDGAVLWSRIYAPTGRNVVRPMVRTDSVQNVYVGMTATSSDTRAALVKLVAGTGAVALERNYVTNNMFAATNLSDLLVNGSNEIVLGMFGPNDTFQQSYMLVKVAAAGTTLWSRVLANIEPTTGFFQFTPPPLAALDSSNNIMTAGTRFIADVGGRSTNRIIVSKVLNTNGSVAWSAAVTPLANASIGVSGVAISVGNPVVAGSTETGTSANPTGQFYTNALRTANGAAFWNKLSAPAAADGIEQGTGVACDTANNVYVVGNANGRALAAKYNAAGARQWLKIFDDATSTDSLFVFQGGQGVVTRGTTDVVVWGLIRLNGYVFKLNTATGAVVWQKKFNSTVRQVVIDSAGNIGVLLMGSTGAVRKLRGTDGVQLWQANYNGAGTDDEPVALARDSANNLIVTGSTSDPAANCVGEANERYYTVKYGVANGAILWQKTQAPFSAPGLAMPVNVLVDSANNVIVVGTMDSPTTKLDLGAFKYRASDGLLLWQQRRDLGAFDQFATAATIDPQGNAIVTCATPGSGSNGIDTWTLKLASSNGNPLWTRVAPTGGGSNFPTDVTVGPTGQVFVTGFSYNGTAASHFLSRLNPTTGAVVWTVTNPAAATTFMRDPKLAASPNGRIVQVGTTSSSAQLMNLIVRSFNGGA